MEREAALKIRKFASGLKKDYADGRVFLFGSRAKNSNLLDSDYDVIVVSKKFDGLNFYKRTEKMYDYWGEKEPLDAFCYTPKEFAEKGKRIGFVSEAMKKAAKIA